MDTATQVSENPAEPFTKAVRRQVLEKIVSSKEFAASPRLLEFLTYVVEEQIAGRSAGIKGKTVAVDVYGRDLGKDSGINIVRVEARRLRRLLDEYYNGSGKSEPIRLFIDPGGYAPRFEGRAEPLTEEEPPERPASWKWLHSRRQFALVIGAVCAFVAILAYALTMQTPEQRSVADQTKRTILREQSVKALQAADFAAEGRALMFPLFELKRQQIALDMFEQAIELAPQLPDGHAGAAQVLGTMALLAPTEDQKRKFLTKARSHAETAFGISRSDAWAIAAEAWVLALDGQHEEAMKSARLAADLEPDNGYILDLVGIAAIVANDPGLAAKVSDPDRPRLGNGRFGAQNIWGVANLMLKRNQLTVHAFSTAAETGAPVSAPSLFFLAMASDRMGNSAKARSLIAEMQQTWPEFPTTFLIGRIFAADVSTKDELLDRFERLSSTQ